MIIPQSFPNFDSNSPKSENLTITQGSTLNTTDLDKHNIKIYSSSVTTIEMKIGGTKKVKPHVEPIKSHYIKKEDIYTEAVPQSGIPTLQIGLNQEENSPTKKLINEIGTFETEPESETARGYFRRETEMMKEEEKEDTLLNIKKEDNPYDLYFKPTVF